MIGYAEPRKVTKIYQKDAKINDFRGLQRGSARKRTETTRCAPQARRTEARRRRANTASVAIGRQSSRATKKKLPRRRTFCRTKPAPKRPPRGQTNIARGSGHPSEANDSNLDALREHESPPEVGDLKRSKKRLFLRRDAPRGSVLPPRRTDQWVVAPRANDQVHPYHPDSSNTFSNAPMTI